MMINRILHKASPTLFQKVFLPSMTALACFSSASSASSEGITLRIFPHKSHSFNVSGRVGESLYDIVLRNESEINEHLECACGGIAGKYLPRNSAFSSAIF